MTHSLDHATILIVAGRSLSTFHLQRAFEREGAAVCVASLKEALSALRHVQPDAAVIDFALSARCDELLDDLDVLGIAHVVCGSPSVQQSSAGQLSGAQDVVAFVAERLQVRGATDMPWRRTTLDAELRAI